MLRYVAYTQQKLPDAILPLLQACKVRDQPILKTYPYLYEAYKVRCQSTQYGIHPHLSENPNLRLLRIEFCFGDVPRDMQQIPLHDLPSLARHIEENIGQLRIQAQWVVHEEAMQSNIQVFCAAPSFPSNIDWTDHQPITNCLRRISIAILRAQYGALAKMARLVEIDWGQLTPPRSLHLTAVGMGVFNNPPEAPSKSLEATLEPLKGSNVPVCLHGYHQRDIDNWNHALVANGYGAVRFDADPVVQAHKLAPVDRPAQPDPQALPVVQAQKPVPLDRIVQPGPQALRPRLIDKSFFTNPRIPEEFDNFFTDIQSQLGLTTAIGKLKIKQWKTDPTHQPSLADIIQERIPESNYGQLINQATQTLAQVQDPLVSFCSLEDIENMRAEPQVYVVLGLPGELLQHLDQADGAIVQIASQFNALETPNTEYFMNCIATASAQGPSACRQALSTAILRFAAHANRQLLDAMLFLLRGCKVHGGQPINEKYPELYLNGQLNLLVIKDENDIRDLADYIANNARKLKIPMQWGMCEESENKQLQVFCSMPTFRTMQGVTWDNPGEYEFWLTNYKAISIALAHAQYGTLAKIAQLSGWPLHLTAIGMGVFNNPSEVPSESLGAVLNPLKGSPIKIYLHGYRQKDIDNWNHALKVNGYDPVHPNARNPIVQAHKTTQ
jgi:hypothetical protein